MKILKYCLLWLIHATFEMGPTSWLNTTRTIVACIHVLLVIHSKLCWNIMFVLMYNFSKLAQASYVFGT